ncbi:hypothetical protein CROQUDRAFT_100198 [Cronartium quercuum f. sp. fusiforme G11]|uniref:Uncharacterized protein n=1 Tax=Cronartium quercuum f. sp. fusiforme G11 TaxID=708437 RepID=A0A9P6N7F9_9BASI|nr:hypothetical protein CROQUDRAFT_100198 [Cronartium quercuum f. sp. fusiforme G11]
MDPRWQEEAVNWQAKRHSQNSIIKDLTSTYRGPLYPSEWSQSSVNKWRFIGAMSNGSLKHTEAGS